MSGHSSGYAVVWGINERKEIKIVRGSFGAVHVAVINRPNNLILAAFTNRCFKILNTENYEIIQNVDNAHSRLIKEVSTAEGVGFLSCSEDATMKLWSGEANEILNFTGHEASVLSVKAISDGK